MISVENLADLWPPAIYDTSPGTNNRKILEVIAEGMEDVQTDLANIRALKNLSTIDGKNLEQWAAEYDLQRRDFTDNQLIVLLTAYLNREVTGTTIEAVYNFVKLLYNDVHIVQRWRDELGHRLDGSRRLDGTHTLDGASSGFRPLAFDVIINETITDEVFLLETINDIVKMAGVDVTINLYGTGVYGAGLYGAGLYGNNESGEYPAN